MIKNISLNVLNHHELSIVRHKHLVMRLLTDGQWRMSRIV